MNNDGMIQPGGNDPQPNPNQLPPQPANFNNFQSPVQSMPDAPQAPMPAPQPPVAPSKKPLNAWMFVAIGLIVAVVGIAALSVWLYVNYNEQKTNVDSKVTAAVSDAKKTQADEDEAKFAEREKEPNRQFVGPEDYGRLTFDYPKTWSVYVAKDVAQGGTYEAYLNPVTVPPVSTQTRYGLRVTIEDRDYDKVVSSYDSLVKKGDLKSSAAAVDGQNGTRLDGNFSKDIRGAAVIFKIRDKTLTLRTDADTFKPDFENIIKTIKFNQ